jgi:citrate synthase
MLGVPGGDTQKLEKLLRVFYVLHMDHGGGNLSTFVGKSVASDGTGVGAGVGGAPAAVGATAQPPSIVSRCALMSATSCPASWPA